ncbi:hypothetical protein AB1Y20_005880 [Prymnesium parvum]|uniref:Arylamine N-acetyltransferase n=1 Tax=Prymnesium parvum TaxID=97485 RepID=A0AB34J3E2_PRYPA
MEWFVEDGVAALATDGQLVRSSGEAPRAQQPHPSLPSFAREPPESIGSRAAARERIGSLLNEGIKWECVSDEGLEEFIAASEDVPFLLRTQLFDAIFAPSLTFFTTESTVVQRVETKLETTKTEWGIGFPLGNPSATPRDVIRCCWVQGNTVVFETAKGGHVDTVQRTPEDDGLLITTCCTTKHDKERRLRHAISFRSF